MATDTAPEQATEAAPVEASAAGGKGFWLRLAAIGGLLAVVIGAQFYIIMTFMGGAAAAPEIDNEALTSDNAVSIDDTVEVELSNFNCTNGVAEQGHAVHVSFSLVVTVSKGVEETFGLKAKKDNKHRIKESVNRVIRGASVKELDDPELDTIKRRIRDEINKILNQSFIQDVIITDFRKMDQ